MIDKPNSTEAVGPNDTPLCPPPDPEPVTYSFELDEIQSVNITAIAAMTVVVPKPPPRFNVCIVVVPKPPPG